MDSTYWLPLQEYIYQLEGEGKVSRTFRRLDPDRQERILLAILEEAGARGPASLNIKSVAERAGVAVGSLYTYFPNRDGLLDFAVAVCVRFCIDTFEAITPPLAALPLGEALAAYLSSGVEWSRTQAGLLQLFARAAYQGDPDLNERLVRPIAEAMLAMIHELVTQAAARGELRPDLDLPATARLLNTFLIAAADAQLFPYLNTYYQLHNPEIAPERTLAALLSIVLEGIARPPAGTGL